MRFWVTWSFERAHSRLLLKIPRALARICCSARQLFVCADGRSRWLARGLLMFLRCALSELCLRMLSKEPDSLRSVEPGCHQRVVWVALKPFPFGRPVRWNPERRRKANAAVARTFCVSESSVVRKSALSRIAAIGSITMLRDRSMSASGKLHRSVGPTRERQLWAGQVDPETSAFVKLSPGILQVLNQSVFSFHSPTGRSAPKGA